MQQPDNSLPPPTGLVLKYVLLGTGTQNYTCTVPGSTAAPGTTGALATLYDLGTKLSSDPLAKWKINTLSGLTLSMSSYPQVLGLFLSASGYNNILGKHFFSSAGVPTFALENVQTNPFPQVNGKKNATMTAPADSCPGKTNEGAVPWLQLIDAGGSCGGINTVYRLETAGGSAPATCAGITTTTFEVAYAAQYWIYGPA
ncbi:uncharacterized protein BDZ99DRAFT_374537 [Mytilinidion resinicola]|uniref:Malate dehydrogenase n=1 Tax=Mytilinidion resinicola TaxID=574789 RepID=A0A6A6Z7I2_9PEZI|nr:uncharacterized protein BDZ99DRAFT_374537 [Mytilinidion resinicola]KAF2817062.1 hypothetical protein BDZ99DRAFT_374537 [Mytilinidion resinicola]